MEKEELLKKKADSSVKFTKEDQAKLSEVTEAIVDLEDELEAIESAKSSKEPAVNSASIKPTADKASGYVPQKGTEQLVHVSIIRGQRFDENTGQELTKPYVQMFTYPEFKNFKKQASLIGYKIVEVLYNPFKES